MRTIRLNDVDLSRRAEQLGGWPSALYQDPGADPPGMAGCRLPPMPRPDDPKRDER
jgi:hypothetical protein